MLKDLPNKNNFNISPSLIGYNMSVYEECVVRAVDFLANFLLLIKYVVSKVEQYKVVIL